MIRDALALIGESYGQATQEKFGCNATRLTKLAHGYICQGRSIDFGIICWPIGGNSIEAHNLTPLSELPEDIPVKLNLSVVR